MFCFQEVQVFTTVGEMERFLLEHGEQIVDVLGSEVDRIEDRIKVSGVSVVHVWGGNFLQKLL